METMDFSVASPIETIGFRTKSSVFGNIQVAIIKGEDGVNYNVSVEDHTMIFTPASPAPGEDYVRIEGTKVIFTLPGS